ncbi:hypothetical protein AMYX_35870 [Anaeromyxobacter diazotrophicus]|uniref:Uncharacterized protein n=1 Tax=Anaeromyxobacter diazotrophicus TaxID=2590199 RepID=A0A7I9VR00_9BACT|nr:hypothetical protein AMYX_35870 [Anaeromyxobacter diazotrophicus]
MATKKFSKRTATPKPGRRTENLGCLVLLAIPSAFAVGAWRAGNSVAAALLAALAVPAVAYRIWGRLLVALALMQWRGQASRGFWSYRTCHYQLDRQHRTG